MISSVVVLFSFILIGCNKDSLQATWNDQQLKIDGFYADWGPRLLYNEKSNIGFSVANDSTDLYVCLVSADQQLIREVMMRGLEYGIDAPKAKGIIKIKYPIGMGAKNMPGMSGMRPGGFGGEMGQPQRGQRTGKNSSKTLDRLETQDQMPKIADIQTEFHIYGPKKDDKRIIPMRNNLGIDIKVGQSERQLVYELKIPFKIIRSYLQISPNVSLSQLDLKFKLPDNQQSAMPAREGGEMSGPPGGGGMGGPPGSGEMNNSSSQDFKFNIRALLADSQ